MIKAASHFFLDLIERKPAIGYFGAIVPTGTGLWVFVQRATALLALVSVIVGIAVGIITFVVQRETLKKLRSEK